MVTKMAQQIGAVHNIFRYRNFSILKDQTLGHGSYGAVYKARCDQLICAAKVLHPTIVDPYDPGSGRILQRFQQECDFLNHIRHPHIVQYLGVCRDPESNLPVLLMELLDESLTKMLERSQHPISYHIQVDLCHDVSLAVAYLHSNGIIHRDLSGNNVLVIAGRRAKVTDFGMSKLVRSDRQMTPLTLCPGTLGYMSPESLVDPPRYTEKLDVFSEGVIIIQVCTRQFPDPGPATEIVEDPRSPTGTMQMPVLEPERRKKHIDLIDPTHPLLPIAIECLKYREKDRPSAEELCQRLAALKENPEYIESSPLMTPATSEVIRTLEDEQARQDNVAAKNLEIARLKEQVENILSELQELNETNQHLNKQIKDLQMQNDDLQRQRKVMPELKPPSKEINFKWTDGGKAPFSCWRESSVGGGNMAYFTSDEDVYSYESSTGIWNTLPECPQKYGSLAVVKGLLTMVGGKTKARKLPRQTVHPRVLNRELFSAISMETNKLVSLTETGKWVVQFPPMHTSRKHSTANTYLHHLIVTGGTLTDFGNTDVVEVLNTQTLVWSTAASLPHPFAEASATICDDRLYILGGNDRKGKQSRSVFSCSLPELLQPRSHSLLTKLQSQAVWQRDADTPVFLSTCATVHGQLVTVGGEDKREQPTTAVYKYNPNTRSWNVISHMMTARSACYVAVTNDQMIVVSGYVKGLKSSDIVETVDF